MKTSENLFFSNANYRLYYIQDSNVLIVESYGYIKLETAQEAWTTATDKAAEYQVRRWISDEVQVELVSPEASKWWINEWYPTNQKRLGFKKKTLTATILSKRFYAEMSTKMAATKTLHYEAKVGQQNKHLEHLYFQSLEEAYAWIVSHQEA
ncbi:hypothetical protein BKI52_28160 [marine bacterium AO1-C]|nr:hypothetical protein BKI52_28160 [marine bacterium AO1-C]